MAPLLEDQQPTDTDALVTRARGGDEAAFGALVDRHRRELHVHCYRMLGSFDEAEDLVQDTYLRAWRKLDSYEGEGGFRAWLYRIATNACLDTLRRNARRVPTLSSMSDVPWLQPYPDHLLDEVASSSADPDEVAVARETIELAFLAVMQHLPPRQRAVVLLRDVLGWSAGDTAAALETSVPAANSALQRARATLKANLPERRAEWSVGTPTDEERELLARFIDAHDRSDAAAAAAMMRDDIRITMPPAPISFDGIGVVAGALATAFGVEAEGEWRLVPIAANRMPAAASYLRRWDDDTFRAFKIDVVRVVDGAVAEITTFGVSRFPVFGLPEVLA